MGALLRIVLGASYPMQPFLNVDVRDSYGFDISESVTVRLHLDPASTPERIALHYDRVGGPGRVEVTVAPAGGGGGLVEVSAVLPAARLANRGDHGTELTPAVIDPPLPGAGARWPLPPYCQQRNRVPIHR